jgi:hypothetical protein
MPEISRFYGIIIRMFAEPAARHRAAHFHAYYQDAVAVYAFEPVELLAGSLPPKQRRLVEAWAELHAQELTLDWTRLQNGELPDPIRPLA